MATGVWAGTFRLRVDTLSSNGIEVSALHLISIVPILSILCLPITGCVLRVSLLGLCFLGIAPLVTLLGAQPIASSMDSISLYPAFFFHVVLRGIGGRLCALNASCRLSWGCSVVCVCCHSLPFCLCVLF